MDGHGDFESDDERALVHIPMAMRYRLDRSGIKLSLKQWQALPIVLRRRVLELPCDTESAIDAFQREVSALVQEFADEDVTRFEAVRPPAWQRASPPEELNEALRESACDALTVDTWRRLGEFQRYVLLALARPGRVSVRLPGALREFCDALPREHVTRRSGPGDGAWRLERVKGIEPSS